MAAVGFGPVPGERDRLAYEVTVLPVIDGEHLVVRLELPRAGRSCLCRRLPGQDRGPQPRDRLLFAAHSPSGSGIDSISAALRRPAPAPSSPLIPPRVPPPPRPRQPSAAGPATPPRCTSCRSARGS